MSVSVDIILNCIYLQHRKKNKKGIIYIFIEFCVLCAISGISFICSFIGHTFALCLLQNAIIYILYIFSCFYSFSVRFKKRKQHKIFVVCSRMALLRVNLLFLHNFFIVIFFGNKKTKHFQLYFIFFSSQTHTRMIRNTLSSLYQISSINIIQIAYIFYIFV